MSFRAWMLVATLGLMFLPTLAQAQEQAQSPSRNAKTDDGPPNENAFSIPVELVESEEATKARESREAESRQNEIDDLVAQQGMNAATQAMNDATQKMALHSLLSTIAVWAGTGLLIWTLFETRRTANAANDTLRADRAYVAYDECFAEWWFGETGVPEGLGPDGVVVPHGISVAIIFRNFGKTPARQVRVVCFPELRAVGSGAPNPPTLDKIAAKAALARTERPDEGSFLAPSQTTGTDLCHITFDEIRAVRSGEMRYFATAGAVYADVFGEKQWCSIGVKIDFLAPVDVMVSQPLDIRKCIRARHSISGNVNT